MDDNSSAGASKRLRLETPQDRARQQQQQLRKAVVLTMFAVALVVLIEGERRRRSTRSAVVARSRKDWGEHVAQMVREKKFRRMYRMDITAFAKLVKLLRPALERNEDFARLRTPAGVITVAARVGIAIRLLAGGSYLDVTSIHGVADNTAYMCLWQVIDAINNTKGVGDFNFPQSRAECTRMAGEFKALSTNGVMGGCVGAVDGLHISTSAPSRNTVLNVTDYYSGNKRGYGLNVQAIATATLRFSAVSTIAPGSANDWRAWNNSSLSRATARLPRGFYLFGDAAYPLSEQLLTPYPGRNLPSDKDSFNFHLSQCRIRAEMAFGVFVQTWGILWRPLRVKTEGRTDLLMALFRLHNFLHDERVTPVALSEEDSRSRRLRPVMNNPATAGGEVIPETFRTSPATTPRRAGDTPTRAALTRVLDNCRQYRPDWNITRNS